MTFQNEFPDFDPKEMPAIPEGFKDMSWHNDSCPYFANPAIRLGVFIDFADPLMREEPETNRFSLVECGDIGDVTGEAPILTTDSWDEVLHKIGDTLSELERQTR